VLLIIFGQILFLSLFLSMLLSKFDEVQELSLALTLNVSWGVKGVQ
ncbi:hypothetical protein AK812_SmicGene47281, partial [Symbiodinium microadriaticum]